MGKLTEDQIERQVEARQNGLDKVWINGNLSQEEYNAGCKKISDWAESQYRS